MVNIKRGRDFKAGDPGLGIMKKASSDAYVAVGWAKFGKPVWSTRVILGDMGPVSMHFDPLKLTTDMGLRRSGMRLLSSLWVRRKSTRRNV